MGSTIEKLLTDVGWSLWSAFGVPSVVSNHRNVAIDPEPLVLHSAFLFGSDSRLSELVALAVQIHAHRFSKSRMKGLLLTAHKEVVIAYEARLAAAFEGHSAGASSTRTTEKLPRVAVAKAMPGGDLRGRATRGKRKSLPSRLRSDEPGLIRMRARALVGVGAKADVISELLSTPMRWQTAAELEHLGFAKRSLATALTELEEAALVHTRARGNANEYAIAERGPWNALLNVEGLAWPDWRRLWAFSTEALRLDRFRGEDALIRRIEAANARERLAPLAVSLRLRGAPATSGYPDAWDLVHHWLMDELGALASGEAEIFRPV